MKNVYLHSLSSSLHDNRNLKVGTVKFYSVPINMELPIEGKPVVRMIFGYAEIHTDLNEEVSRALSCTARAVSRPTI